MTNQTLSWFEDKKREANIKAGYEETKGLKDGHCNRRDCQAPLADEPQDHSMTDHEHFTNNRLYYCGKCAVLFNDADKYSPDGPRITSEDK